MLQGGRLGGGDAVQPVQHNYESDHEQRKQRGIQGQKADDGALAPGYLGRERCESFIDILELFVDLIEASVNLLEVFVDLLVLVQLLLESSVAEANGRSQIRKTR